MNSREIILSKIKRLLTENPKIQEDEFLFPDSEIFMSISDNPIDTFKDELTKVNGNFVYCDTKDDLLQTLKYYQTTQNWKNIFCKDNSIKNLLNKVAINFSDKEDDFLDLKVGITTCEYLIARYGSVMVSSKSGSGRRLNVYPDIHVVIAYTSQLVNELKDAYTGIIQKYKMELPSLITLITGPSRTADIEKTLILGAHGPKEIYVFLVNDKNIM